MIYRIKQVLNYIFSDINIEEVESVKYILTSKEYEIFLNMDKYDKIHCLGVYKKIKIDNLLKDDKLYIKLGLLHDCGKEDIGLFRRIKKVVIKDELLERHPKLGYEKIKDINLELAKLILKHHNDKISDEKLKRFQEIDDIS